MFIKRLEVFQHYKPLLQQLVMKDIKLKYRRSFGICLEYIKSIDDYVYHGFGIPEYVSI